MPIWIRLMLLATLLVVPRAATAQCEANASSCVDCHEVRGRRPVLDDPSPWHLDHAFGDLCAACHAGDPAAVDERAAHAGLRDPLADPASTCGSCHPADPGDRAAGYVSSPRPPVPPAPARAETSGPRPADVVLAALAAGLGAAILALVARRRAWIAWVRARSWSPYSAGVALGLIVAVAVAAVGRPLSASGAFDKLAAYPGVALFGDAPYYAHGITPGVTWPVWLMIGVLGGAFASSTFAHDARLRWLPDTQWVPRFGGRRWVRLALAFVGALLVQLGAGIAGGCTGGLALSGGAVLAPAAFVFMAGMFAGGIPAAWLLHRGGAR